MGPTTKSITLRGDVTFEQLSDSYYVQAKGLIDGGADILLLETAFDTRNVKAGVLAIQKLEREIGESIPLMISGTIERWGAMLAGQPIDALYASLSHANLLSIGLNCATGPDMMTDHIRTLAEMASTRISCYPNAGLPNEEDKYMETPESLAKQLEKFVERGWLNIVGGCCGTTPAHIRAIAQMAEGRPPHKVNSPSHRAYYSGIELVEVLVERTGGEERPWRCPAPNTEGHGPLPRGDRPAPEEKHGECGADRGATEDRKSTRLNSSH